MEDNRRNNPHHNSNGTHRDPRDSRDPRDPYSTSNVRRSHKASSSSKKRGLDPFLVLFAIAVIIIIILLVMMVATNKDDSSKKNDKNAQTTEAVVPTKAPQSEPTKAPENTPEAEPTKAPEATPEATPEVTPEVTPEATPEATPTPQEPTKAPAPTKIPSTDVKIEPVNGKYIIPSIEENPALLTKKVDVFLKAGDVETWTSLNDNGIYYNKYGNSFKNNYDGTMTGQDGVVYTIGHVNVFERQN